MPPTDAQVTGIFIRGLSAQRMMAEERLLMGALRRLELSVDDLTLMPQDERPVIVRQRKLPQLEYCWVTFRGQVVLTWVWIHSDDGSALSTHYEPLPGSVV